MYVSVLFVQVYVVISLFMVWLAQCNVCRVQFVQVYQSVGGLVCSVQCQRAVLLKALPRCAAARTPAREDAGRAELGAAPPHQGPHLLQLLHPAHLAQAHPVQTGAD